MAGWVGGQASPPGGGSVLAPGAGRAGPGGGSAVGVRAAQTPVRWALQLGSQGAPFTFEVDWDPFPRLGATAWVG